MGLDVGRVNRGCAVHARRSRQGIENLGPKTLATPAVEAIVDRCVGDIDLRTIPPARTGLQHVHDPSDHPPVIDAMRAFATAGKKRLNPQQSGSEVPANMQFS